MGISITAIANHNFNIQDRPAAAEKALAMLRTVQLNRRFSLELQQENKPCKGEWEYSLPSTGTTCIEFDGPYYVWPTFHPHCMLMDTIYRYSFLFHNEPTDWLVEFRKELYAIVQLFGSTEVIYFPDNDIFLDTCNELLSEGKGYDTIKAKLYERFGEPITSFAQLDEYKLTGTPTKAYFLDDFRDLV